MPIKRMWGGRFEESGSDLVNKFGASITFDQEMAQEDIQGSLAHVKMLKATKILNAADADAIIKGLETLDEKLKQGKLSFNIENEDIHMNIEALLTAEIGPVAGKLGEVETTRLPPICICTSKNGCLKSSRLSSSCSKSWSTRPVTTLRPSCRAILTCSMPNRSHMVII